MITSIIDWFHYTRIISISQLHSAEFLLLIQSDFQSLVVQFCRLWKNSNYTSLRKSDIRISVSYTHLQETGWEIVNEGISGYTTVGMLVRLRALLADRDICVQRPLVPVSYTHLVDAI